MAHAGQNHGRSLLLMAFRQQQSKWYAKKDMQKDVRQHLCIVVEHLILDVVLHTGFVQKARITCLHPMMMTGR